MPKNWRRFWPVAAITVAAIVVVVVHVAADRITREAPNYSLIEDGLWLGGFVPEPPPGCGAVLNLCESEDPYHVGSYKWAPIRDAEPAPDLDWLREQVAFIESERSAGRVVFVHCRNGVSRSGMVMAAYLMKREHWPRDKTLEFLRSRRPGVRPHPAFLQLLLEWEHSH
ncbi:dual specificity protein phosphatase family protein [Zavarzinella formosa]|uniref:dual specificity protein phosphatase family protein n=1 Tax=Zavarzinella formosa TaxID=360055 RepID=UPI0002F4DEB8|nr:dual specificity protein phosphatase [Zavarzinella formosa]